MPAEVERVLETMGPVRALARELADERCVLFLGRHVGYPVALEGALKLKELAYMHAEGFAAGELKHGPIALIEDGMPVVVVVPSPEGRGVLHDKLVSNIQEIRARGARVIVIADEGDSEVKQFADTLIEVPAVPTLFQPLVATVPLQVFACELATAKGLDVDQPRNLAKSVTVVAPPPEGRMADPATPWSAPPWSATPWSATPWSAAPWADPRLPPRTTHPHPSQSPQPPHSASARPGHLLVSELFCPQGGRKVH